MSLKGTEPSEPSDEAEVTAHLGIKPNTDHPSDETTDEDYTSDTHDHPKELIIDKTDDVSDESGDEPIEEEACSACTKPTLETVNQKK